MIDQTEEDRAAIAAAQDHQAKLQRAAAAPPDSALVQLLISTGEMLARRPDVFLALLQALLPTLLDLLRRSPELAQTYRDILSEINADVPVA